jgi:hypothetical protein
MMDYNFLRKILYSDSSEVILKAYKSLSNEGLEVYVKDSKTDFKMADDNLEGVSLLMLPAADWDLGKRILTDEGLQEYITDCQVPEGAKSDTDVVMEKYLKKQKWTYIQTAVIIVLAMVYFMFKTFFH